MDRGRPTRLSSKSGCGGRNRTLAARPRVGGSWIMCLRLPCRLPPPPGQAAAVGQSRGQDCLPGVDAKAPVQ